VGGGRKPGFKARECLDAEPTVDPALRARLLADLGTLGLYRGFREQAAGGGIRAKTALVQEHIVHY
jgi:hypothetical protein